MDRLDRTLSLPDGRRLGYADLGDPRGAPAFFFHGWPSSRLEAIRAHRAARRLRVRLLALDRPGYGLSDFHPGRTLRDWPDDVARFADAMGLERFAVVGNSGGGPYALACAWRLADRVACTALVAALGPCDDDAARRPLPAWARLGLGLAFRAPRCAAAVYRLLGTVPRRAPNLLLAQGAFTLCPADRRALREVRFRRLIERTYREAHRQGSRGPAHDVLLYSRPWGFGPEDVAAPVRLWHGECDTIVPVAMGRALARRLPRCRATFLPGEGHFSLMARSPATVLGALRGPD